MKIIKSIVFIWFCVGVEMLQGTAKQYLPYRTDLKPLQVFTQEYNRYLDIKKLEKGGLLPKKLIREKIKILEKALVNSPKWVDGKWLLAASHIGLSSTLIDPKEEAQALFHIEQAERLSRQCRRAVPNHSLCTFFLAVALGQKGAYQGVFASLGMAEEIHDLFMEVRSGKHDLVFDEYGSVQGSTRDALGIFMRVVPDIALLDWIYGIRGNKAKSIQFHKEGISLIGPNICNVLYLGAAKICYGHSEDKESLIQSGIQDLKRARNYVAANEFLRNCKQDTFKVARDNGLACGYTPIRQQEQKEDITAEDLHKTSH